MINMFQILIVLYDNLCQPRVFRIKQLRIAPRPEFRPVQKRNKIAFNFSIPHSELLMQRYTWTCVGRYILRADQ